MEPGRVVTYVYISILEYDRITETNFSPQIKGHAKLEDGLNIRDLLDLKEAFMVRIKVSIYHSRQFAL